ncbi:MAG: hypothetical protein ACREBU_11860 [Nitrososphaera sp.]
MDMQAVGKILLSRAERKFLDDLLAGKVSDKTYSYNYRKVLKKRILRKRKQLTEDIHLISKAEDLLSRV